MPLTDELKSTLATLDRPHAMARAHAHGEPQRLRRARRWSELSEGDLDAAAAAHVTVGLLDKAVEALTSDQALADAIAASVDGEASRVHRQLDGCASTEAEREKFDAENVQDQFDGGRIS